MSFDQIILWVMAFGALIGAADKIIGNRFGLGEKFDEGFQAMGSLALGRSCKIAPKDHLEVKDNVLHRTEGPSSLSP